MNDLMFRCSELASIMATCKDAISSVQLKRIEELESKEKLTATQKAELTKLIKKRDNPPTFDLSEGAKNFVRDKIKQKVLGYYIEVETPQMLKGTDCESKSIALFNDVKFKSLKKNIERLTNDWITGECDLIDDSTIYDIKTSWTKATFPMLPDEIKVGGYEWQGRGYMMLYDRPKFELVYALVNTPEELLDYELNLDLHIVDDIDPHLRITTLSFERDLVKEELIKHKVNEARKYAAWYLEQIKSK